MSDQGEGRRRRDIAYRLRHWTPAGGVDAHQIMAEAAGEIDQLRTRVGDLEAIIEFGAGEDPVRDGWIGKDGRP